MPDIDLQKTLRDAHARAKESRASDGFKDDNMIPYALVVGEDQKIVMIACVMNPRDAMPHIWETAKKEKAIAVIFSSDARAINSEKYCQHYGITMAEFDTHRSRELRAVGGSYGDLPKEVWHDMVVSWAKGPSFPDTQISTFYTEGPDDTVVFDESKETPENVTIFMLKPWW